MNILICDDQQEYIDNMVELINVIIQKDINYYISTFCSGEEFISYIKNNKNKAVDLVFMDIEMNNLNGIETVKYLRNEYINCMVFFVTSHTKYISDIFRLNAFQFIQKPINKEEFSIDLNRAIKQYKNNHKKIKIKVNDEEIILDYSSIKYIEINQKKIYIYTNKETIIHFGKLKNYIDELSSFGFVNSHKSYLVNLRHIKKVNVDSIEINNCNSYIPLSRNNRKEFLCQFKKYCLEMCI